VVDFSVQTSRGDLRIWAFSSTGEARVWDINTISHHVCPRDGSIEVKKLTMRSNGSIESAVLTEQKILPCMPISNEPPSNPSSTTSTLLPKIDQHGLSIKPVNTDPAAEYPGHLRLSDSLNNPINFSSVTGIPERGSPPVTNFTDAYFDPGKTPVSRPSACMLDLTIPTLSMAPGEWCDVKACHANRCAEEQGRLNSDNTQIGARAGRTT